MEDTSAVTIGERINYLRVIRRRITMEDLANNLKVPVYEKNKIVGFKQVTSGTISNIENNKHRPNADLVDVLADYFGVSPTWLLRGQEYDGKLHPPFDQMKMQDYFASMTPEQLEAQQRIIDEMRKKALGNSE